MKPLTTYQISQMVNADISTVIDWIDSGKLKAYKTPGGHRRIKWNDLIKFLKKYEMPIPDVIATASAVSLRGTAVAIPKKILIVDDNEDILEFISRALKKFYKNVKIETITEGFIAGKRIAEFKPDLLILDIKLPGMDGFAVLEHLKCSGRVSLPDSEETSQLHIKNMKILAITGYPSKETKEKILKAGADDYLMKPFTVEELKQKVENLMGGKK
ncbi:MAG: response regulator [Elusimicrobia bacterium]|nr:response regulator [Elusimicrobiota bacterium]